MCSEVILLPVDERPTTAAKTKAKRPGVDEVSLDTNFDSDEGLSDGPDVGQDEVGNEKERAGVRRFTSGEGRAKARHERGRTGLDKKREAES